MYWYSQPNAAQEAAQDRIAALLARADRLLDSPDLPLATGDAIWEARGALESAAHYIASPDDDGERGIARAERRGEILRAVCDGAVAAMRAARDAT